MTSAHSWRGTADERDDADGIDNTARGAGRRLVRRVLRPYKRALAVGSVLIIVQTFAMLSLPYLVGVAIDHGIAPAGEPDGHPGTLIAIVIAIAAIAVAGSLAEYAFLRISGTMAQDILYDLRTMVFSQFQRLSLRFFERFTSGRVVARLTSDIDAISEMLQSALTSVITGLLQVVLIAVALVLLDGRLGLLLVVIAPVLFALSRWFQRRSQATYREVRNAIALVIQFFAETLRGVHAVQAFRAERHNQAIFEDLTGRYRDRSIDAGVLASTFGPSIDGIGRVATAAVLIAGAWLVLGHAMTIGVLTASVLYVRQLFDPMQDLSQFYNIFQSAGAAFDKLGAVMDERSSVPEPRQPAVVDATHGGVALRHVSFAYDGRRAVLTDVDLSIPAGQTVALVGATGAGKSTLARLLARMYDPTEGCVLLDGVDLRTISDADLRRAVIMVTQESFLFSGTVAENIGFGAPGATARDIEAAARAAGAHDFIERLPEGYDTPVQKGGSRLSAGQRQLVAFARAFLADPAVLILDEATSSLDIPTERAVQRAVHELLSGRTGIIIAHRLSTVEIADRVLVMSHGRIVEDGAPAALLSSGGDYAGLQQAWVASLA